MSQDNGLCTTLNVLSDKLEEYLKMKGVVIDSTGFHSCISPTHPDHNPSSSIGGDKEFAGKVTHCFSCGKSFSIFHAAHFFDKKPMTGPDFFQDTLPFLCKLFDVPYEPIKISEDVKREYQKRRAYEDAVNAIHSGIFVKDAVDGKMVLNSCHPAIKHLLDRGITEETIRKFRIGCVSSNKEYLTAMKAIGWDDKTYLEAADLANQKLFSATGIIIPIFDEKNRPVGFVTRKTDMVENEKGNEKYVNSTNSDIYHKSKILFNFQNYEDNAGSLFIVEGYLDAVYLTQMGLKNVVAIGATVLTEEHVDLLFTKKIKNLIICLDGDEGGDRGVKLAIERLSGYKTFNIRIMELPKGMDPDNYVKQFGKDKFIELSRSETALSPFAWMLKHTTFEDDPMETAQSAIPTIAAEESNIVRMKMIRELSRLVGISEDDIRKDVDSLLNKESSHFLEELSEINNFVQVQLSRKKIKDTKSVIEDSLIKIKNLERQFLTTIDNKTEFSNKIGDIKEKIESGKYTYGLKPLKFKRLYENFDGIPYGGACLTLVGGRPSAGKTALLSSLLMDIVDSDDEACVFYMSIDDTTELMTLKLLAVRSGLSTSQVKNYTKLDQDKKDLIDAAWRWIELHSDRFIIVDATAGNTYEALEAHVEWFIKNTTTKKRIFALDNFHKMRSSSFGRGGKKTEIVSDQSEKLKEITQLHGLHLIMTVELRKLEGTDSRPTVGDLKDSVQLEYDADVIMLVHNDLQVNETSMYTYQGLADGVHKCMPYLHTRVWKNKVTGRCETFYYKLNSWNLKIEEESLQTVRAIEARAREKTSDQSIGRRM